MASRLFWFAIEFFSFSYCAWFFLHDFTSLRKESRNPKPLLIWSVVGATGSLLLLLNSIFSFRNNTRLLSSDLAILGLGLAMCALYYCRKLIRRRA